MSAVPGYYGCEARAAGRLRIWSGALAGGVLGTAYLGRHRCVAWMLLDDGCLGWCGWAE